MSSPGARRPAAARRRSRNRRGRGLRAELTPRALPASRTRAQRFDELVLDAVEDLERDWAAELAGVEFMVEDVPEPLPGSGVPEFDPEVVVERGVPLGRLLRGGRAGASTPTIVVYRRPVEARAFDGDERSELVFMVVAELVAELIGRDIDEIDPRGE